MVIIVVLIYVTVNEIRTAGVPFGISTTFETYFLRILTRGSKIHTSLEHSVLGLESWVTEQRFMLLHLCLFTRSKLAGYAV